MVICVTYFRVKYFISKLGIKWHPFRPLFTPEFTYWLCTILIATEIDCTGSPIAFGVEKNENKCLFLYYFVLLQMERNASTPNISEYRGPASHVSAGLLNTVYYLQQFDISLPHSYFIELGESGNRKM